MSHVSSPDAQREYRGGSLVSTPSKWSSDYLVTEPGFQARHIFSRRVWRASQVNFAATEHARAKHLDPNTPLNVSSFMGIILMVGSW
jgi:hypothetical protein